MSKKISALPTYSDPLSSTAYAPVVIDGSTYKFDLNELDSNFDAQNSNLIFAGPSTGSAATPTFRALVSDDLPNPFTKDIVLGDNKFLTGQTTVQSLTIGGQSAGIGKLNSLNTKAPNPVVIYFHGSGENEGTPFNGTGAYVTKELMSKGCIVMTSSGGGISNWGNTTEIAAYKALVDYAFTNFNPSAIYFIGQSMGAVAALNLIASNTVQCNGFWGIYPATNLLWCYNNGFTAQIEAAYSFSGSGAYAAATSGHDPYLATASLYAGSKYKFVASSSDTTISKTNNSDLMQAKLAAINLTSSLFEHTGNHGDSSAFNVTQISEFCKPYSESYTGVVRRFGESGTGASILAVGGPTGSGAYIGTFQDRAIFGQNVCYDGNNWTQFDSTHASSMWMGTSGSWGWWSQSSGNPTSGLGTQWLTLQPGVATFNGQVVIVGDLSLAKTITAPGTTTTQTINKSSGRVNIAAAATSITVNNSLCTANSIITISKATNDSTARLGAVVAGSGSFVIYMDVAPAGEIAVNFRLTN